MSAKGKLAAVPPTDETGPRAAALLRSCIVWDNHGCMPLRADCSFLPQLQRYRQAGVTVVSLNIGFAKTPWTRQLEVLAHMSLQAICSRRRAPSRSADNS